MRRTGLFLTVLVLASVSAAGQGPAIPQVEFDEAIRRAVERNPTVAQAATAVARAEGLLQQARAVTRPAVSAGMVNTTIDTRIGFGDQTFQPRNQFAFNAAASVPVLAAAQWAAVTQATDQIGVARLVAGEVRQQIAVSAAQAYLAVIASRRQVDVDERALDNARAHLDYAQRRFEAGAGSRLNQLRAAQAVSSFEARLEATLLLVRTAQEALGVLLAEDGPVDAGAEPIFVVPEGELDPTWMDARPDIQTRQAVRSAAERVFGDSWKDWLPTAAASFNPQYITPAGLFQPSRTWRLTVTFTQPVFDGGQRRAASYLREVALDASRLELTVAEIQARSEVRLAHDAIRLLDRAAASARLAADQADEVLQITTTAFQVGATTNIEVIDAQRTALDTEAAATLAEDAVRLARLDLLVALGRFPG